MNTSELECLCDRFEEIEGAAVSVYIAQFLEQTDADSENRRIYYICRICGAPWAKTEAEGHDKSSLVRLQTEFNV